MEKFKCIECDVEDVDYEYDCCDDCLIAYENEEYEKEDEEQ